MQAAAQAAKSALSNAPNPPCKTSLPSTARSDVARKLAYVWARMAARYGALWTNSHGAAPGKIDMGEWGHAIDALTESQIREGFEADGFRGSDFPPSSTHFRALCLGMTNADDLALDKRPGAAMYAPVAPRGKRIESDSSKATATRELDAMARILHVQTGDAA